MHQFVAVKPALKRVSVKTGPTGQVVPALFIMGEQDEKNLSPFSDHFLFNFFNSAFIISVFIHALGFEKYGNTCGVVLSHKPLKHRWDAHCRL